MTALQLVSRALRAIAALAPGETLAAGEAADGLVTLNGMINTWAAKRLMIFVVERQPFALVSGTQTYTLGPSGTLNHARPDYISGVSVISNSNPVQPLELGLRLLTQQEWQGVTVKNVTSALPQAVYIDRAFPQRNVSFWPIPNIGGLQTVFYLPTAITSFADQTTNYTFPPGYEECLVYNLALRLAPEYGKQTPSEIVEAARDAMATVKIANLPWDLLAVDPALVFRGSGSYNWLTDQGA